MAKNAIVIGAGIGGLAAASLLATKGRDVTLFEKNDRPGGKMQQWESSGFQFDTGPSLLTMPFQLKKLFEECGKDINDYLSLIEPDPLCRYFYKDGVVFDNFADPDKTVEQIRQFAPKDAEAYRSFLYHSEDLYNKTAEAFLFNPLNDLSDLKKLKWADVLSINAFSTVSKKVDQFFSSPHLRKFFKRFTTYNGSSPYQAPATLNVIPHVELNQGGYYVKGGLYEIAKSLEKLALSMGVSIEYNQNVTSILSDHRRVKAVQINGEKRINTDLIVANSDASETILHLLSSTAISNGKRRRQQNLEPSCSGFVLLLGCDKKWDQLKHHNIFFSDNYKKEFSQIFQDNVLPDDPTIYVANTSVSDPDHAPEGGSNLFVLVNAPYLAKNQDWDHRKKTYRDHIINELEARGLDGLRSAIKTKNIITPLDFYKKYGSNKGSIYGTSSNSIFSAFLRPRNKLREFENLYLVGGSTHPGGGIPLVIQSAFNAMQILERQD
ncbi:MAG: phytoene desaturase family protein [Balneolaceae bacterium]